MLSPRVLIAACLLPVVWVAGASPASAVQRTGPTVSFSFDYDLGRTGGGGDCKVQAQTAWDDTEPMSGGAYVTAGCDIGTGGTFSQLNLEWTGTGDGGAVCTALWSLDTFGNTTQISGWDWQTEGPEYSPFVAGGTPPTSCVMTEMCWQTFADKAFDLDDSGCVELESEPMTAAPEAPNVCLPGGTSVTVKRPVIGAVIHNTADTSSRQNYRRPVTYNVEGGPLTPGEWYVYTVHDFDTMTGYPNGSLGVVLTGALGGQRMVATQTAPPTTFPYVAGGVNGPIWTSRRVPYPGPIAEHYPIVGVGIIHKNTAQAVLGLSSSGFNTSVAQTRQQNVKGLVGITDPAVCAFYWGDKVSEAAGDTDNPLPINEPPPPTGSEDPPVTDPPADEDDDEDCGAICLLEKVLSKLIDLFGQLIAAIGHLIDVITDLLGQVIDGLAGIVEAIAGLVGDLLAGLLDLLKDLFIPSPDSWGSEGLVTQLGESGPTAAIGEIASGLTSTFTTYKNASEGCGVLFDMPIGDASYEGDTCETSTVLGSLKAIVSAGLITITGIGIVRMLGGVLER